MDLERAKGLAQLMHQLRRPLEPLSQVEGLTPMERFAAIGNRIEALSGNTDNFYESSSHVSFKNTADLSLHLTNEYVVSANGGNPRELAYVLAEWFVGRDILASEFVAPPYLQDPDASRKLGLIEESVAEAEKELVSKV